MGSDPKKSGKRPLRERIYHELRENLMLGRFDVQTRLVEASLAAELGVSRTPVREALLRLVADGLLVRRGSGYFPILPNFDQLRHLYELRTTIELQGLARAIESSAVSHDAETLVELRDVWRHHFEDMPSPDPDFVAQDEDFHITLLGASGNPVLTEALAGVNARLRMVRTYDFLTEDRIRKTIVEHLEIVEMTLARRLDDALSALRRHVWESAEVVNERILRSFTQMMLTQSDPDTRSVDSARDRDMRGRE